MQVLNPEMSREEMIKKDEALRQMAAQILPNSEPEQEPEQVEKWLSIVKEPMIHPSDARYMVHKNARKNMGVNLTMSRLGFALKEINHQGRK